MMKKISVFLLIMVLLVSFFTACEEQEKSNEITVVLDWVPNTNHTGLYAALDNGYYEDEGLDVNIIQPPEGGGPEAVEAGQAEFAVSYQEQITFARTAENPLRIKAIAAIIQHNTSGFASPAGKNIKSPKDFEDKVYGGWGSPMEEAMLKGLMDKQGVDFSKLKMVDIGAADFFAATERDVDFTWIFYGWDGVAAEQKDFPINFIKLQDFDSQLDFYTPVLAAGEEFLENNPNIAVKFLKATAKGYKYAIDNPEKAADILLAHAPEIDRDIAVASQKYLADEYMKDTGRWGEMKEEMWKDFAGWMFENGLLERELDAKEAFTNEYLPK